MLPAAPQPQWRKAGIDKLDDNLPAARLAKLLRLSPLVGNGKVVIGLAAGRDTQVEGSAQAVRVFGVQIGTTEQLHGSAPSFSGTIAVVWGRFESSCLPTLVSSRRSICGIRNASMASSSSEVTGRSSRLTAMTAGRVPSLLLAFWPVAGRSSSRWLDWRPRIALALKPRGRSASVRRAKDRYRDRSGSEERARQEQIAQERAEERDMRDRIQQEHREALARQEPWSKPVDLAGDFARAAGDAGGDGGDGGDDGVPVPRISRAERRGERARARRRRRDDDFERER
ncbi:hypothetical protein [Brucella tritici]|uniref:hypothetical protein n=1 Tax=Brucella tritici TaxID=94626 RepID=UPI001F31D1E9|nr:hypothetical protein [Brucella tritici]